MRSRPRRRPIVGVQLVSASLVRVQGARRLQLIDLGVNTVSIARMRSVRTGIRGIGSIRRMLKVVEKGRMVAVAKVVRKAKVVSKVKVAAVALQ
jgi:hypothetical protein